MRGRQDEKVSKELYRSFACVMSAPTTVTALSRTLRARRVSKFRALKPPRSTPKAREETMTTPPPAPHPAPAELPQQTQFHEAPSLPNSPVAKRTKTMASSTPAAAPSTKLADAPPLLVKKLSSVAKTPTRGSKDAAGYDLYA